MITGLPPQTSNDRVCDYTTGEEVYSLRALIKRFSWVRKNTGTNFYFPCTPYNIQITYGTGSLERDQLCSHVDIFSALYAFRTGGMRVKVWDSSSELITAHVLPEHSSIGIDETSTITNLRDMGPTTITEQDSKRVKGSAEFQFPYYGPVYVFVNAMYAEFVETEPDLYFHFTQPQTTGVISRSNASGSVYFAKAAGDDYNLGFLLGVPDCLPEQTALKIVQTSPLPNAPDPTPLTLTSVTFS